LYQSITGNSVVPDALTDGTFIRQAKAGRGLGTYEADEFASHRHTISPGVMNFAGGSTTNSNGGDGDGTQVTATQFTGGSETRPKNIALNLYVKVGY
jgi:hypothetical protein